MRHPPTPPDDKNHEPGYITPPYAVDLLTPQLTPRKLYKQSNAQPAARHGSPRGDTHNMEEQKVVTEGIKYAMREAADSQAHGLASDVVYIPDAQTDLKDEHMQGDKDPQTSPSQQENASPLRIRKKRKQPSPRQRVQLGAYDTVNWNDLPADMITNDNLYSQLRRKNMDRLEAIEDGSAIEAVVLTIGDERKPSLRHVKKRHSLRIASAGSGVSSNASAGAEDPSQERKVSLRHKKAFVPARQDHTFVAPAESISTVPTSPARALRHERRPLSAGGRPQTSSSQSMAFPLIAGPITQPRHVSLPTIMKQDERHGLRRVSREQRLDAKLEAPIEPMQHIYELPLHNNLSIPGFSPSMKSHRFANTMTPMSGISDRTEMELCEAKNVTLFPHSNDSVLLINNGTVAAKPYVSPQLAPRTFRPLSFTFENPEPSSSTSSESLSRSLSTPEIQLNGNVHTVDSPLTNPRAAPLPPAIQFIPPTPSVEGDKQLRLDEISAAQPGVQRRSSLMQAARRLSGTLLTPFALQRRMTLDQTSRPSTAPGNERLHPMWQPTSMWDDDDDDYFDEDDHTYDNHHDSRLPAGGDTSDHPQQRARTSMFPRKMSVRMPGFRGAGGFLQGNSLGVERHGTNKRRHHVELPGKRAQSSDAGFLSAIRRHIKTRSAAKEEAAAEKRRAELKESIGVRLVHHV